MKHDWSPGHERAGAVALDKQAAFPRLDAWQKTTERTSPDKRRAALWLLRFLYWIYERRLLNQLKQKPMPRHIGIILDGNRRHARNGSPRVHSSCFRQQLGWKTRAMLSEIRFSL